MSFILFTKYVKSLCLLYSRLCLLYYFTKFYSTFVLLTPESSSEFPWISIWRLVKPHTNYYADILKARLLRLLNHTDCYVWLYQKNLWLLIFEMHLISGMTDGWQGCKLPPPLAGDFGFLYSRSITDLLLFLYYFLSVSQWAPFI